MYQTFWTERLYVENHTFRVVNRGIEGKGINRLYWITQASLGALKNTVKNYMSSFFFKCLQNKTSFLLPNKWHMTVGHQVFEWSQNPLEEKIGITGISTEDLRAFQGVES